MANRDSIADPGAEPGAPESPRGLGFKGWTAVLRRTVTEFQDDQLTDRAAALTYYAVLSIFPALIALVSIVGLVGDPRTTTDSLTEIVETLGPSSAAETFQGPIEQLTSNRGTAGILLIVGIATAIWTASGYIGAFARASNAIYEVEEGRPFWKLRPLQLAITLAMVLLLALVLVALVVTGPVASAVGDAIGLGDAAVTAWDIAKWPVLLVVVLVMFAVLYYLSPNVKLPGMRWITPGSIVALVLWIVASALFAFYVANFGSYDKTYGTLGGVVTFLVWLWIGNIAVLLGVELNAELERGREIDAGVSGAEESIQLPPRDPAD
jgi:membrane protein